MGDVDEPSVPSAERLFPLLMRRALEGGAFVSTKIERSALPPLLIPGLIVRESLHEGEEILRIPRRLQLTLQLVQELVAELIPAVRALPTDKVRVECPEVVAFITKRLHTLEEFATSDWDDASWLDLLLGMQLSEDFRYMPHRSLIDDSNAKEVLMPSPEAHNAMWNEAAYCESHEAISKQVPAEVRGAKFDLDLFRRSHLLLLTRTFARPTTDQRCIEHCCVPIADMFNHSSDPNSTYEFDISSGDLSVRVNRDVAVGDELFITYGREKSNVRLFRTYGFTMAPAVEPSWSFRVWPTMTTEVYERFLPERVHGKVLDLEAKRVDSTTKLAMQAAADHGADASDFLRAVCDHFQGQYEADSALRPALEELRQVREHQPGCACWWTSEEKLVEALHSSMNSSSSSSKLFAQNALRVKMSEYLCLLAHIEALDILSGASQANKCLDKSVELSELLGQTLESIREARSTEVGSR